MRTEEEFDLFISYATDSDYNLARDLESFLESFHRLPNPDGVELKELKICRDGSDFHVEGTDAATEPTIERYLSRSRELLVLCSRRARVSKWVGDEIRWFLQNRGPGSIRVAITEGARVDEIERIFPEALVQAGLHRKIGYDFRGFRRRPSRHWESVRLYDDERTRLAADLNGRSLSEVSPIWFTEKRRQAVRRMRVAIGVALVTSAIAVFAIVQWREAKANAERARRQLYVTTLNLAERAWEEGSTALLRDALDSQVPRNSEVDLRDFDWFHFERRASALVDELPTPGVALEQVSVSSDGNLVAGAGRRWSEDEEPARFLYIWSLPTGELVKQIECDSSSKGLYHDSLALAFSPVGSDFVAFCETEVIRWNLVGDETRTSARSQGIEKVRFTADGELLAGTSGSTVHVWSSVGNELAELFIDSGWVSEAAILPDGQNLLFGDSEGNVRLWNWRTERQVRVLGKHEGAVTCARLIRNAPPVVATGGVDGLVILWDFNGNGLVLVDIGAPVLSMAVNGNRDLLAIGTGDPQDPESGQTIALVDLSSGIRQAMLKGAGRRIYDLAFTPDGTRLVSAGEDEVVRIWDVEAAQFSNVLGSESRPLWSIDFTADGRRLAVAGGDGAVEVWNLETRKSVRRDGAHHWRTESVAFEPSGSSVASGGNDGVLRVWDPELSASGRELGRSSGMVTDAAFSSDGSILASSGCDGTIRRWRVDDWAPFPDLQLGVCLAFVAWSHSSILATGGGDPANKSAPKTISLIDLNDGGETTTLDGHQAWPRCGAFSADGKLLATGDWDGEVIIWDHEARKKVHTLRGHRGLVTAVTFSPGGKALATAGVDGTVRLWDLRTGQQRIAITETDGQINDLKFGPDGKVLAAATESGHIFLWKGVEGG